MATMVHLNRQFSKYIESIQSLVAENAAFREACDNYEEICTWLAERCPGTGSDSKECEDAREQMRELEDEIQTLLEKHHDEEHHERT
jgi:uncharacterized protein YdcH (DUF465 family)